jgi:hypothetical protein
MSDIDDLVMCPAHAVDHTEFLRCADCEDARKAAAKVRRWADHTIAPEAWRDNREPGWFNDLGYKFDDILNSHRYEYDLKGARPDDPGWHECSCGWEGYWHGFNDHVANELRAAVTGPGGSVRTEFSATDDVSVDLELINSPGYFDGPSHPTAAAGRADFVNDGADVLVSRIVTDWTVVPNEGRRFV